MSEKMLQDEVKMAFAKNGLKLESEKLLADICDLFEYINISGTESLGRNGSNPINILCFKTNCDESSEKIVREICGQDMEKRQKLSDVIYFLINTYISSAKIDENYLNIFNLFNKNDILYGKLFENFETRFIAQFPTRIRMLLSSFTRYLIEQDKGQIDGLFKEFEILFNEKILDGIELILKKNDCKNEETPLKERVKQAIEVLFRTLIRIDMIKNSAEFNNLERTKKQFIFKYEQTMISFFEKNKGSIINLYRKEFEDGKFKGITNVQKLYYKEQDKIDIGEQLNKDKIDTEKEVDEIEKELSKIEYEIKNNLSNYCRCLATDIKEFNKIKSLEEKVNKCCINKELFGERLKYVTDKLNFDLCKQISDFNTDKCLKENINDFLKQTTPDTDKYDKIVQECKRCNSPIKIGVYELIKNVTGNEDIDNKKVENGLKTYSKDSTNFDILKDQLNCSEEEKNNKIEELRSLNDIQNIKRFEYDNVGTKSNNKNNSLYTDLPRITGFNCNIENECKKITGEFVFDNKKKGIEIEFNIGITLGKFYANHGVYNCHILLNVLKANSGDFKKSKIKIDNKLVEGLDDLKKLFIRKRDFVRTFTGCKNFDSLKRELMEYGIELGKQQRDIKR